MTQRRRGGKRGAYFSYRLPRDIPTPRQLSILREIASGKQHREIAQSWHISPQTIKNHMSELYYRLKADGSTHALSIALKRGLIQLDEIALFENGETQ